MDGRQPTEQEVEEKIPSHKHPSALPPAIVDLLEPIYEKLSDRTLLSKCLGGYTQNACEALNALIWKRCSKEGFSGATYLQFAAANAVLHFNEGKIGHAKMFPHMGLAIGRHSVEQYIVADSRRMSETARKNSEISKKIRQARRLKRSHQYDNDLAKEGEVYCAGGGDDL